MAEREKQLHRRATGDLELQLGSLQSQSSASSTGFCMYHSFKVEKLVRMYLVRGKARWRGYWQRKKKKKKDNTKL